MRLRRLAAPVAFALSAALLACGDSGPLTVTRSGVRVEGLHLVAEHALSPTLTESTYTATCRAEGQSYDDALVFVASSEPGVLVVDPTAHCGRLTQGASAASADLVVIHRDPALPFDPAALEWVTLAFGPSTRVLSEGAPGGGL